MKRSLLYLLLVLFLIFIIGCTQQTPQRMQDEMMEEMTETEMEEKAMEQQKMIEEMEPEPMQDGWRDAELKDVLTGSTFKISDFKGKPILLESFAVWCPTCRKQQEKIKELHEDVGDSVISISLDTDPNEDTSKVIGHANKNDFDWLFAVSPTAVTQELIDEFGISVVNAPGAPVVLICGDQSARLLGRGVKSVDRLKQEIGKC